LSVADQEAGTGRLQSPAYLLLLTLECPVRSDSDLLPLTSD
jgi:hypothetical protein